MKPKIPFQRKFAVIIAALAVSLTASLKTFAVEGLQLSLQCSNVVLSWPSIPGQNYIIQYRQTLDPSTPWQTLTNLYPGDWTTNVTVFVHSNIVQHPNCGGTGGGSLAAISMMDSDVAAPVPPPVPMAVRADGSGPAVPLTLFPPGFDLSTFVIFDPSTGEQVSGAGFTRTAATLDSSGLPAPLDGGSGGGTNSVAPPETGFYQVIQDGVQIASSSLTNLTNGPLSDIVNIKFEAGYADPNNGTNLIDTLSGATLLVDGAKYAGDGAYISAPSDYPWQFALDTARLPNGDHWVQVQVFWFDPASAEDGTEGMYPSRYSDSVMITVSNAVSYPQWEEDIGEAGTNVAYFLQTTCMNADWSLAIYDVNSNLVQTLTGHTDDGTIEAYWNMMDSSGVMRTNADVDPEFSSVITVADPITKPTPKKKRVKNDWPDHGVWTVAYLDYFKHFYDPNSDMIGHINEFTLTAQKYGGYWLYYPPAGSTNDVGQTYPLRYQNSKHTDEVVTSAQITKDSAMLKAMLSNTNSRNFFYRGHGGPDQVGYVSASELSKVIKHRYRFVLLQACDTADGQLDHAFGIKGPGQFDIPDYQKSGLRPAAFMGNHGESAFANTGRETINGVPYDGRIPWQIPYLYYNFLFYWDADLMGWSLYDSMGEAMMDMPSVSGWGSQDQPGACLKIYGYPFLHIDEYNYRNSWP